MIDTVRSEWIKLRTVRMNFVLAALAVGFPLIVTVLTTALIDIDDMSSRDLVEMVTGTSIITGMLLGVIGATAITSEFGFGTIRPTFAATPRRSRVLVAKAIVTIAMALAVEAIVVVLCFGIGSALLNGRGDDIALGDVDLGRQALIGVVLFAAIVALLGYGLGLLTRNSPAAVAVLILWPLLAEPLVGALLGVIGLDNPLKWMPYQAGGELLDVYPSDSETFGRVAGGLYFLVVATAVTVAGALVTSRRDA